MKQLTFILPLLFYASSISSQIDPILATDLQNILDNSVANSGNNGVSAHLIMPGGQVWSGTAGVGADNLMMTDSTVFVGASMTRFNVAILLFQLAEEGLVDLDDPWASYLDLDVAFDPAIAVRELLDHTSGIADYLETPTSGNDVTADFNYFVYSSIYSRERRE